MQEFETIRQQSFKLERDGNYTSAIAIQSVLAKEITRIFGPGHLTVYDLHLRISAMLFKQGRFKKSMQICRGVLKDAQYSLNPTHEIMCRSRKLYFYNLLKFESKIDEAIEVGTHVVSFEKRAMGPMNEISIISKNLLAKALTSKGKYDDALKLYVEGLNAIVARWGSNHKMTIPTRRAIAEVYASKGDFLNAISSAEYNLTLIREAYGIEHTKYKEVNDFLKRCNEEDTKL